MATTRKVKDAMSGQPSGLGQSLTAVDNPSRLLIRRRESKRRTSFCEEDCNKYNYPIFPTSLQSCRNKSNPIASMSGVTGSSSPRNTVTGHYSSPSVPLLANQQQQQQRQLYIRTVEKEVPCPEAIGYTQGKTLGSGTYAKVKAAWSPFERRMIAIKNLNKEVATKEYLSKFLPREIEVLQSVRHPNVIQVFQIIETEKKAFLMLELAENGDLLDYINTRRYLHEPEARFIFRQMSCGIAYCHSLDIIHRDLKCENIMLSKDMDVKIGDFGFALQTNKSAATTPCGSYSYAAPELFTSNGQAYDGKKADVWSLGVILYAMVCGRLPFGDDNQIRKMTTRELHFTRPISHDCRVFLKAVLNMKVEERFDSTQIQLSGWAGMQPITRPRGFSPQKYSIDNCLPQLLHAARPSTAAFSEDSGSRMVITSPYPSMQPIGGPMQNNTTTSHVVTMHVHQPIDPIHHPHSIRQSAFTQTAPSECSTKPAPIPTIPPPPQIIQGVNTQLHSHGQSVGVGGGGQHSYTPVRRPLVAKIGAAGRRIADAVKQVGHHSKGHSSSRHSSAGSNKSIVS